MASIKWETANHMMNIIAFAAMKNSIEHEEQIDIESIKKFALYMFQEYCDTVGITEVDDPDEENVKVFEDGDFHDYYFGPYFDNDEEDEEEEEDDDDDSCRYSLTPKGEFALRYMEAGHTFEEACKVADILFGDGE